MKYASAVALLACVACADVDGGNITQRIEKGVPVYEYTSPPGQKLTGERAVARARSIGDFGVVVGEGNVRIHLSNGEYWLRRVIVDGSDYAVLASIQRPVLTGIDRTRPFAESLSEVTGCWPTGEVWNRSNGISSSHYIVRLDCDSQKPHRR